MSLTKKKIKTLGGIQPTTPKVFFWMGTVLFLALTVRLFYLLESRQSPFFEPVILDPNYYHRWALRILAGDWVGEPVFYGLPLYPFFLAMCYKIFTPSILAVKIIQTFLGLTTVYLIYKIGSKIDSLRTGILAALIASFYGPFFFHETILIPEALAIPLYGIALYLALIFWDSFSWRKGFLLGIVLGLATLAKAGILLFVFSFLVLFLWKQMRLKARPFLAALALCAGFLLPIAPVTAHNVIYGKDFVPLTSHGGFNFYIGNNLEAEGVFLAPEGTGNNVETQIRDSELVAERSMGRKLKSSEVSKFWSDKAWNYIQNNPDDFVRLTFHKLLLFFDAREISDVDDFEFSKKLVPFLKWPWIYFGIVGPLFFVGVFCAFMRLRYRSIVLLWIFSYILGVTLFFINARYRLPILSAVIAVAALGAVEIWDTVKQRRFVKLLACLAVLGAGIFVTQLKLVNTNWEVNQNNAADIYFRQKNYEKAMDFYRSSLNVNPRSFKASQGMGLILTKLGRYEEAKEYFLRSIEARPKNPAGYNNLGLWYDREGDLEKAKEMFLKAAALGPTFSEAHNNLGMVYGKMGDSAKAKEEFETALRMNPKSARAYTNLGLILYRLGDPQGAREQWVQALKVDPGFEEARRALEHLGSRS